jgi:glycosyltransferase involved in cell wall biosynthesis
MMRRADHIFSYTATGAQVAILSGVTANHVTVLGNTSDVEGLLTAAAALSESDLRSFRISHGLGDATAYCYIGGLDGDKRVEWLAEALGHLYRIDPSIKVLLAGHGSQRHLLDDAQRRSQLIDVGYADDRMKAIMAGVCDAVLSPGRIGLVAVDALAMKLPIVTSDFSFHAPEVEYLTEGESIVSVMGGPEKYAEFLARRKLPKVTSRPPSLNDMVARFQEGILAML